MEDLRCFPKASRGKLFFHETWRCTDILGSGCLLSGSQQRHYVICSSPLPSFCCFGRVEPVSRGIYARSRYSPHFSDKFVSMDRVIDSITLHTVENGLITR